MKMNRCKKLVNDGFTLLEVVIALAIISLAIVQLSFAIEQSHFNLGRLEEKTLAQIIASNELLTIQSEPEWPSVGVRQKEQEMANINWTIKTTVRPLTEISNLPGADRMRSIEVQVGKRAEFGDQANYVVLLRAIKTEKKYAKPTS